MSRPPSSKRPPQMAFEIGVDRRSRMDSAAKVLGPSFRWSDFCREAVDAKCEEVLVNRRKALIAEAKALGLSLIEEDGEPVLDAPKALPSPPQKAEKGGTAEIGKQAAPKVRRHKSGAPIYPIGTRVQILLHGSHRSWADAHVDSLVENTDQGTSRGPVVRVRLASGDDPLTYWRWYPATEKTRSYPEWRRVRPQRSADHRLLWLKGEASSRIKFSPARTSLDSLED